LPLPGQPDEACRQTERSRRRWSKIRCSIIEALAVCDGQVIGEAHTIDDAVARPRRRNEPFGGQQWNHTNSFKNFNFSTS
jgi:hypothetical protein